MMKYDFDAFCCSYLGELENNPDIDRSETLGQFIKSRGYSELFQKAYLVRLLLKQIWAFRFTFFEKLFCSTEI